MMSGFELSSMLLTTCQTYSGRCSQIVLLAATAAQTRPVPNVALSSLHGAAIECFLGCLGQLFPLPRHRVVTDHATHWGLVEAHKLRQSRSCGESPHSTELN